MLVTNSHVKGMGIQKKQYSGIKRFLLCISKENQIAQERLLIRLKIEINL